MTREELGLIDAVQQYLWGLWDPGSGGFRFATDCPPTLTATGQAVLGLELAGGLETNVTGRAGKIASFLEAGLRADGSFVDPLFDANDVESTVHDPRYFREETTTFCQQALDALGVSPPPPRIWPEEWLRPRGIVRHLEALPWEDAWLDSNRVMFILGQLCHDIERHGKTEYVELIDAALDWLDTQHSAETGLWEGPNSVSLTNAMAATFHFTFFYFYRNRKLQHPGRIIDSCLQLQESHGLFSGSEVGHTCLDYDALDLLAKCSLLTDHRTGDVREAMHRARRALLSLRNFEDGGFVHARERCVRRRLPWLVKGLLEQAGMSEMTFRREKIVNDFTVGGWRLLRCNTGSSNSLSTWFRLLALRLVTSTAAKPVDRSISTGRFRRLPFLGFHPDPMPVTAEGDRKQVSEVELGLGASVG